MTDTKPDTTALNDLLARITEPGVRELATALLADAPAAFWSAPASTSGKYHPAYAAGKGGLIRHTRAVAHIAMHLCELEDAPPLFRDLALAACLCHDAYKVLREGEYTNFLHPQLAADVMLRLGQQFGGTRASYAEALARAIASHMGRWNTSPRHSETLPLPDSRLAELVHTADYLASRKHLLPEA